MSVTKLGFGLSTCQCHPADRRPDPERYCQALEFAAQADRLGFESVWVSEHHFVDDGHCLQLLPLAAAITARTERCAIVTGLLLAPLHEPVRIAEDAADVDCLSNGFLATEASPAAFAEQVGWALEARARAGGDPARLAVGAVVSVFPWEGRDAFERILPFHQYGDWKYQDMEGRAYGTDRRRLAPPRPEATGTERLLGPALVEQMDATTLALSGQVLVLDPQRALWLREAPGR